MNTRVKQFLKKFPLTAPLYRMAKSAVASGAEVRIPEVEPIGARKSEAYGKQLRLNLLTPSVDTAHVFGGIATAIRFFEELRKKIGCDARIITCDAPVISETSVAPSDYVVVSAKEDSLKPYQLISFADRSGKTIPVAENDIFVATGWWTAYTVKAVLHAQSEYFGVPVRPLVYMIQDYEPGFYPWSSRYLMADSTYRMDSPVYAVINSSILRDYFVNEGYSFSAMWSFDPVLNPALISCLPEKETVPKKKQILVYGRPHTDRNAFTLLVYALRLFAGKMSNVAEWTFLSAGETHETIDLGNGATLKAAGKMPLRDYAQTMCDSYAGISLMVSPHPSYPPLEMSTFGVKTITNCYKNKDIADFNGNIVSLKNCSPETVAEALLGICENYSGTGTVYKNTDYAKGGAPFGTVTDELSEKLRLQFGVAENPQ